MPLFNLEFLSKLLIKYNLKTMKDININFQISAFQEMGQLKDKGHYSENNIFGVMSLLNLEVLSKLRIKFVN